MHSETEMRSREACVHQHGSLYSSMSDLPWTENAESTEAWGILPPCSCPCPVSEASKNKQSLDHLRLSGHPPI